MYCLGNNNYRLLDQQSLQHIHIQELQVQVQLEL